MSIHSGPFSRSRFQKSGAWFAILGTVLFILSAQVGLRAEQTPADLVLINGKIITVDLQDHIVQAVAAKDGKISAVGTTEEIRGYIGPDTQVIDLGGKTVTPGLIDSHAHIAHYGMIKLESVDLRPPAASCIADIARLIGERVATVSPGDWVRGEGFFEMADKRNPTRADIDPVSPDNPVFLTSLGGHFGTANSNALELAGIDKNTPDPVGGFIERDATTGEPTGVLWNHQAMDLVRKYIPVRTKEQATSLILYAQDRYIAEGLTGFHDNNTKGIPILQGYLGAESQLKFRGTLYFNVEKEADEQITLQYMQLAKRPMLSLAGNKMFLDGQVPTAYTHAPHPGMSWDKPTWDPDVFKRIVKNLNRAGRQLSFHVVGDAAIDLALDAIEEALADTPRADHRHRLEHVCIPTPQAIQRIKQLGVTVALQPGFIYISGDAMLYAFGTDRMQTAIPVKSFLDAGVPVGFGSDYPEVLEISPQIALWSAVNRLSDTGKQLTPNERVTIQQALRAHTIGSAYLGFEENEKGSIEVGKYADFTVWSGDLYTVPAMQIKDLRAVMTIINGKVVNRLGDVNFDGLTDVTDVVKMARFATKAETPTEAQTTIGDFDHNGVLDVGDWVAAVNALLLNP
jgi:predicted amidohydrolase YtcJ